MKQSAIDQAKQRLERARHALKRMEDAKTFASFETPWSEFLMAASGVYSKLEQGAKGCPPSEGWFGRKKHDRKKDPLLKYLHHARNTDEHGLGGTTLQFTEVKIKNDKVNGIKVDLVAGDSVIRPVGDGAEIEVLRRYTALHAVTDTRYGDTFMPPTEHLGRPIVEGKDLVNALDVARLGLAYLDRIFIEATQLPRQV
jgi:hypothetical protein